MMSSSPGPRCCSPGCSTGSRTATVAVKPATAAVHHPCRAPTTSADLSSRSSSLQLASSSSSRDRSLSPVSRRSVRHDAGRAAGGRARTRTPGCGPTRSASRSAPRRCPCSTAARSRWCTWPGAPTGWSSSRTRRRRRPGRSRRRRRSADGPPIPAPWSTTSGCTSAIRSPPGRTPRPRRHRSPRPDLRARVPDGGSSRSAAMPCQRTGNVWVPP